MSEQPVGISSEDQIFADSALASVQRHWWSGLGGSELEQGLTIADPLPEPYGKIKVEPRGVYASSPSVYIR